jgi:outer membrane protein assembly factor BamB
MMIKLSDKDIKTLRTVSQTAGIFTIIVALLMIFSLVQLKTINPLDNPALLAVKEQYDKDPEKAGNAEQVRALDLMARKAYFATRRQVETGSYLLLAGAIIFIFCQRLIEGNEKNLPEIPGTKTGQLTSHTRRRKYILGSASFLTLAAVVASFMLRSNLPDLNAGKTANGESQKVSRKNAVFKPDKTDFPFFRGQDSRGIAGGGDFPTEWDGESGKNIKWKTAIPEKGKSTPVIWDDKIFITGADGNDCKVICIDKKNGERLWSASASGLEGEPSELPEMDEESGLAVPTAATDGKVVCAIFANGNLACFDLKGNKKWAKNLGLPESVYGFSSSLVIYDKILIVKYDSDQKNSLMGFDTESGSMNWETVRQGRPTWSSPVIAIFNGEPQIVINGNPEVSAYDPLSGKELWAIECMSGDVAPSVAVNSTMAYAVTDYAKLVAIKPGPVPSIVWEDNAYTPDVSSPVATDDFLFVSTGNGDVACYNAMAGDTLWTHYYMDPFYASPVIAGELVYFLDRSGMMHIVKAGEKYELVAESSIGEPADCTPSFSDKSIFLRTKNNLYCISEK